MRFIFVLYVSLFSTVFAAPLTTNVPAGTIELSGFASQIPAGMSLVRVTGSGSGDLFTNTVIEAGPVSASTPNPCLGPCVVVGGLGQAAGSVDPASGAIHGFASAVNGNHPANGVLFAGFADVLTLSDPATVSISGLLDGNVAYSNAGFLMEMGFGFYDPQSVGSCGEGGSTCAFTYGATTYNDNEGGNVVTVPNSGPNYVVPFGVTADLPAGQSLLIGYLMLNAGAGFSGSESSLDFSHTLHFALTTDDDVTITSSLGIPINPADTTVPEPSSALLAGMGIGAALIGRSVRAAMGRRRSACRKAKLERSTIPA